MQESTRYFDTQPLHSIAASIRKETLKGGIIDFIFYKLLFLWKWVNARNSLTESEISHSGYAGRRLVVPLLGATFGGCLSRLKPGLKHG